MFQKLLVMGQSNGWFRKKIIFKKIKLWVHPLSKGAFTLGVRDSSVESPNTMLVI
jgi:hypothetical protein